MPGPLPPESEAEHTPQEGHVCGGKKVWWFAVEGDLGSRRLGTRDLGVMETQKKLRHLEDMGSLLGFRV